jgi:hypothetical protein
MGDRRLLLERYKPWGLSWDLVPLPKSGSSACRGFFETWAKTNSLLAYVLSVTAHVTKTKEIAQQYFHEVHGDPVDKFDAPGSPVDILKKHFQVLFEMLICRHVDNYLTYLSNLLFEAFKVRPELLQSSAKVDVNLIIQQRSMDELIRILAERRVEKMAYEPFNELRKFFRSKLGIQIALDDDIKRLTEAIETRNISVHNGCVINRRYVNRLRLESSLIGTPKRLTIEDVEPLGILLGDLVKDIDAAACERLELVPNSFDIDPHA